MPQGAGLARCALTLQPECEVVVRFSVEACLVYDINPQATMRVCAGASEVTQGHFGQSASVLVIGIFPRMLVAGKETPVARVAEW